MNTNQLVIENMSTITRVCAGFNTYLSQDDLVQEVVETLLVHGHHYSPAKGSPKGFVANAARNKCISILKRHANSRRGTSVDTVGVDAEDGEPMGHVLVDTDTPLAALERKVARSKVLANVAALTADERATLDAIANTNKLGDAAKVLGVSQPTMTRRRKALIAKLAQ